MACTICGKLKDVEYATFSAGFVFSPAVEAARQKFEMVAETLGFRWEALYQCPECGVYYYFLNDEEMYGSGLCDSFNLSRVKLEPKYKEVIKVARELLLKEHSEKYRPKAEIKRLAEEFGAAELGGGN